MSNDLFTMARELVAGAKDLAEGTDRLVLALETNVKFRTAVLDVWKRRICGDIMRAILHAERHAAINHVPPEHSESKPPCKGESGEKLRKAYTTEAVSYVGMMSYRLFAGQRAADANYSDFEESKRRYTLQHDGAAKQIKIHDIFLTRWVKSKHNQIAMDVFTAKQWEAINQQVNDVK
jgi:hypothetical protein